MKAVIPSLCYADFLAAILPAWIALLSREVLTVVTSPGDAESQALAHAAGVSVVVTDAWTRDGAALNKAVALDEAFGIIPGFRPPPSTGEICLSLDCDVVPFGQFPRDREIQADTIYGCARYHCRTPSDLRRHVRGRSKRHRLELIPPKVRGQNYVTVENTYQNALASARCCLGYFQLFRYRTGLSFGSHQTAGKYDLTFRAQFPHREALWDLYVLHLGESNRANWRGRVLPRWA